MGAYNQPPNAISVLSLSVHTTQFLAISHVQRLRHADLLCPRVVAVAGCPAYGPSLQLRALRTEATSIAGHLAVGWPLVSRRLAVVQAEGAERYHRDNGGD